MAQISTANLRTVLDKIARHAGEFNGDALASAVATGGVYAVTSPNAGLSVANTDVLSALQTTIAGLADANQLADLLPPIRDLNLASPDVKAALSAFWAAQIKGLNIHGQRYNALASADLSGLDAMLRVLNASTPTLRAHGAFSKYLGGLSATNVFVPTPFTVATIVATGATTATFTHVAALDTTLYAPGQIAILNTKTEGLVSTVLTLTCTKSGVATSVAFTVGTTTNNYLTAGADTALAFTDCTALVSISGGVNTDTFSVVILPDRAISAA